MKSPLTTGVIVAIAALATAGTACANPALPDNLAPQEQVAQAPAPQHVQWHYVWQYHLNKWGQYVPEWVAVPTYAR